MQMKPRTNFEVGLAAPLVILYLIGIAGFWAPSYVPAISDLIKQGVNEEWLGFFGSIIGAIVALLAAFGAWIAVRLQINAQEKLADDERLRKEFAARGVLPLSLSALHNYAQQCIKILEELLSTIPFGRTYIVGTVLVAPPLPLQDVRDIRAALEHMAPQPAQQLVNTLHFLQIQHSRLSGVATKALDGELTAYDAQRSLFDALDLAGLIDRSFVYARGNDFKSPRINSSELLTQILIHGMSDAHPWVREELERREKRQGG
jgi:hypothetical protein